MKEEKLIKLSKIFLLTYMILTFVSILLPDELVIGITKLDYRIDPFQMIMRWLQFVGFLVLPVAVYFDKPTFKKLAVYFCLPVAIIFMFLFKDMLPGFTSELGTGIASIRYLPQFISDLMRNGVFRTIIFFAMMLSKLATIALIILRDKSFLKFKKQDIMPFIVLLVALTLAIVPIYAPEAIFDHQSNIDFTMFSVAHIVWMMLIVGESVILYKIFKNKDYDSKYILDLLYVKNGFQSNGVGVLIWNELEKLYPNTTVWETCTPCFDKRNVHFYVNKCGFHIVEFQREINEEGFVGDGGEGMFVFKKWM